MLPVHMRMAELWTQQRKRELSNEEQTEMVMCLQINADYAFKLSKLNNLLTMANVIDDFEWQLDICQQIDKLEIEYKIKKPAHRNAD